MSGVRLRVTTLQWERFPEMIGVELEGLAISPIEIVFNPTGSGTASVAVDCDQWEFDSRVRPELRMGFDEGGA